MSTLFAVALNACVIRFRLDHAWGWLRIAFATMDAFLYAAAIFLVVSTAFGRGGMDRYFLVVLGLIALRWTLSCLIASDTVAPLSALMAREVRRARLHALVYVMTPPTLVYAMSLVGFVVVTQIAGSGENTLAGLTWFPVIFVVHALFNAAAVLIVSELWRRNWLTSNAPAVIAAALLWFVSPVMYRFDDLGLTGTALLTSYSPASHVIAAYHNSFWFGQPISLEVLPLAALAAAFVAAVLLRLETEIDRLPVMMQLPALAGRLTLIVDPENTLVRREGLPEVGSGWAVYRPIRTVPRNLSGQDWVRLEFIMGRFRNPGGFDTFARRVEAESGLGDLYRRAMTLYPEWAFDRLVCTLAFDGDAERIVLDGLFDALQRDQVEASWAWLTEHSRNAEAVAVISNRLLMPGDAAEGDFILLRKNMSLVSGKISKDLPAAYYAYLESAGGGN